MERLLVYDGKTYDNFSITEHGEVRNILTNHVYKNSIHSSGYCMVYLPLGKRGKVKAVRVHKAVAETFIPNPDNLPIVHHKDDNKANPDCSNLEWTTHSGNTKHHHNNLKKQTEYYNNRKLNNDDIRTIKICQSMKISHNKIAKVFNVSKTTISNLLRGLSYQDN